MAGIAGKPKSQGLVHTLLTSNPEFRGSFFYDVRACLQSYNIRFQSDKSTGQSEKLQDAMLKHLLTVLEKESETKALINDGDHCGGE